MPTVTDADLVLGYLNAANFLGGEMRLDVEASRRAISAIASQLDVDVLDAAWGICNVVNENMASAARIHIAENGYDPRNFSMVATGGAGPVHAVEVARKLRIPQVLIPIAAGAGSCLGMLAAPARVDKAWSEPQLLADVDWASVARNLADLRRQGEVELRSAGASEICWEVGAEMRYQGQGAELPVSIPYGEIGPQTAAILLEEFEAQYRKLYGRLVPSAAPQVITWRLVGRAPTRGQHFEWGDDRVRPQPSTQDAREIYLPLRRKFGLVDVYDRYSLPAGTVLEGPLVLEERESTIVVPVDSAVTVRPDLTISVIIREFD